MTTDQSPADPSGEDQHEDEWVWTSWIRGRRKRWQQLGEKFWRVPVDIKEQRYGICRECEEFISFTTQCRVCFCAMGIKTWYAGFACPKDKWPAVAVPSGKKGVDDQ